MEELATSTADFGRKKRADLSTDPTARSPSASVHH
jgi:hypothetical protein